MSKVPELGDGDVTRLLNAVRSLKARGVTRPVIETYLDQIYKPKPPPKPPPGIQLPTTFKPTHQTAGLPGFPAIDVFGTGGTPVLCPADGELVYVHKIPWDEKKHVGGWTGYVVTPNSCYFLTHFGSMVKPGKIRKAELIGVVGTVPHNAWEAHIHEGLHKGAYDPRT